MKRVLQIPRFYCEIATQSGRNAVVTESKKEKLDFKLLKHPSKVPVKPILQDCASTHLERDVIDSTTVHLLERLSLVELDNSEALDTLKGSIEYASQIGNVNTDGVRPLYTVLEAQSLHLRKDFVNEESCREEILQNAKVTDEDYFVSPPGNIPLDNERKNFIDE